jgi:hypothetical protein
MRADSPKLLGTIALVACWCAFIAPVKVQAQFYDDPGLGQKPVAAYPQDYKPLGIRAGSFMLHPGVQLAFEYTDNVFFTENNKKSDMVYHIRPYVTAQSTWSRHSLNVTLSADIAFFGTYDRQDYTDYFLDASGRVDVKTNSFFSYNLNYMDLHQDRSNRDSIQGFEPTRYHTFGGSFGYDHTFNRLSVGASYNPQWLDYDNSVSLTGEVIDNQDQDRQGDIWSFNAGYQFQTDMRAFVTYAPYSVKYDEDINSGYDRSGNGYSLSGGVNFNITGKLNGDLYASYHDRTYDDPELPDDNGWGLGAGLQWNPTYLTSVYGRIDSGIEESTNLFSSGYFRRQYSVRADHELTPFLQLNAFVSYTDNDYTQIPGAPAEAREYDNIWRSGIGLNWFINRYFYLNASYGWEQLETNVPNDGYTVNRVWLTLGAEL